MFVNGIQVKDEQGNQIVHTNAADIQGAFIHYWGEVYSKKAFDFDKAAKILHLTSDSSRICLNLRN